MNKRLLTLTLTLTFFAVNLFAAATATPDKKPVAGTALVGKVEGGKTSVEFLALANPGSLKIRGKIKEDAANPVQGNLRLEGDNL